MGITSCKVKANSDGYNGNEKMEETAVATWFIKTTGKNVGLLAVRDGMTSATPDPVPARYGAYQINGDFDENLLAKTIDVKRVAGTIDAWLATVNYSNTIDAEQGAENPLDRPGVDEWDMEQYQRAFEKDINGDPIVTPAGQPFDPPITFDDSRPMLTYTRNEATYPTAILTHQDAVNSDPFLIFPAKTAKVNVRASKQVEGQHRFYAVRYVFHFRWDGWEREGLNRGTWFRKTVGGEVIKDQLKTPRLLDENGLLTDKDSPTYTKVKGYREKPFAPLNIIIS